MNKDTDNSQETPKIKPVDSQHLLLDHNKTKKHLPVALIVVVAIVLLGGVYYLSNNTKDETLNKRSDTAANSEYSDSEESDEPITELKGDQKITSSLGFVVAYDSGVFDGYAETTDHSPSSPKYTVTGQSYEASQTSETRDYSIAKLKFKGSEDSGYDFSLVTNIRAAYWDKRTVLPENAGKSKLDIYVAETIASISDDANGQTVSVPEPATVGKNQYMKFTETFTNPANMDLVTEYIYYLTVVNDRPYRVALMVEKDDDYTENLAKLEQILAAVEFTGLDTAKLAQ